MTRKQKRLALIGAGMAFIAASAALVAVALRDEIVFFHSPSDIIANQPAPDTRIRLGGLVAEGSITRDGGTKVSFDVTDTANVIRVTYDGILPDLFREGQGVVTEGALDGRSGTFVADTVLAKHDENYMPREVADALKAQGHWEPGKGEP